MNSHRLSLVALASLALALVGCNRSQSGSSLAPGAATSVIYKQSVTDLRVGVESPALVPLSSGAVLEYTIDPALPSGLAIERKSGVISGVPQVASARAIYTVRARVQGGAIIPSQVEIEVHADFVPSRFAYSLNLFPSSINTWRIDSASDELDSAAGLAFDGAPVRATAHPLGDRLFVLDFQGARVQSYAINPDDGNLTLIDSDPTGPFPLALAVSPDGRFVYTGSSDRLAVFRVDPVTRRLVASAPPLFVPEIAAIEVLPDGHRLAVSSTRFDAVAVVAVNEDTGAYAGLLGIANVPAPYALAVAPDGTRVHAASFVGNVLDTYDIATPGLNLALLQRVNIDGGTFDIERRGADLWAAHYSAKTLTHFTVDSAGVPTTPGTSVTLPGSAPRVRALEGGGYAAPMFDLGIAQLGELDVATTRFQALRPLACDLVFVPAPTARTRTVPFSIVLDADLGAVMVLSSSDGSTLVGPLSTGPGPLALASSSVGDRLAVGDGSTGSFRRYAVDAAAPTLTPKGTTTPAGFAVRDLVYDGDGRRLWVMTDSQLVTFDVRGSVPAQVDQTTLGPSPARLALDPAGRFLVVTDRQDDLLRLLLVGPNTNDPFLGQGSPFNLRDLGDPAVGAGASAFEPGGRFLFVALESIGAVRSYAIGPITASVTLTGSATGLGHPVDLVVGQRGDLAFVVDDVGSALHLLAIDPKGVPSLIDTANLPSAPRRLVLVQDGAGVQVICADGTWLRYEVMDGLLSAVSSADTGLTNPVDFAPITVWVDDEP